ncbi:MAG: hypothetical protein NDI94_00270 [Candidatus Woesearchaeota archaeon]|nr:hypothetical protein [Candidatus Woesearchaeota archaeon]
MLTYLYAFIFGYITAKIFSGSHEHVPGPLGSLFIHLNRLKIHIHHWMTGFLAISLLFLFKTFIGKAISQFDIHVIVFFTGIVFQGIIGFKDWKEIVVR